MLCKHVIHYITPVICYKHQTEHVCDELGMKVVGNTYIHFVVFYLHQYPWLLKTIAIFWLCLCVDGPSVPHNLQV